MLIHARVQEALGMYCQKRGESGLSQKHFTKSLRIVTDLSELDEESSLNFLELENLKGIKIIVIPLNYNLVNIKKIFISFIHVTNKEYSKSMNGWLILCANKLESTLHVRIHVR